MADLTLDLDELERLHSRINGALRVINDPSSMAEEVGPLVGDAGLAEAVSSFSTTWNKHRLDIRDRLDWLSSSVDKIGTSFENMDSELATSLAPRATSGKPAAATPAERPRGPVAI